MTEPHIHMLTDCIDCDRRGVNDRDPGLCETCDGRGYFEVCSACKQPMGNARRKWKREQAGEEA